MDNLGFTHCDVDQSVFFKAIDHELTVILVHVDDCTIAVTSIKLMGWVKSNVKSYVEITDLGEIHWLLDINVRITQELAGIKPLP